MSTQPRHQQPPTPNNQTIAGPSDIAHHPRVPQKKTADWSFGGRYRLGSVSSTLLEYQNSCSVVGSAIRIFPPQSREHLPALPGFSQFCLVCRLAAPRWQDKTMKPNRLLKAKEPLLVPEVRASRPELRGVGTPASSSSRRICTYAYPVSYAEDSRRSTRIC